MLCVSAQLLSAQRGTDAELTSLWLSDGGLGRASLGLGVSARLGLIPP